MLNPIRFSLQANRRAIKKFNRTAMQNTVAATNRCEGRQRTFRPLYTGRICIHPERNIARYDRMDVET
jgi:hypothetical protein